METRKQNSTTIDDLVERFIKARVHQGDKSQFVFLIGAGVSRSAGIPTAREIVEELRKLIFARDNKIEFGAVEEEEPEEVEEWINQNYPLLESGDYGQHMIEFCPTRKCRRLYMEELMKRAPHYNQAHRYLALILKQGVFARTVFTTNFDDLLHRALADLGEGFQFFDEPALVNRVSSTEVRVQIAHIHGRYQNYSIQNTPDEILSVSERIRERFREFVEQKGIIVVGYSGWDDVCKPILQEACENPAISPNGLYWTFHRDVDPDLIRQFRFPERYYIEDMDADTFFKELYEKIAIELGEEVFPDLIAEPVSHVKRKLLEIQTKLKEIKDSTENDFEFTSELKAQLSINLETLEATENFFRQKSLEIEQQRMKIAKAKTLQTELESLKRKFDSVEDAKEQMHAIRSITGLVLKSNNLESSIKGIEWLQFVGTKSPLDIQVIWQICNCLFSILTHHSWKKPLYSAAAKCSKKILEVHPDLPRSYIYRFEALLVTEDSPLDVAISIIDQYVQDLRIQKNWYGRYRLQIRKEVIYFWTTWKRWWSSEKKMFDEYSGQISAYKAWNSRFQKQNS